MRRRTRPLPAQIVAFPRHHSRVARVALIAAAIPLAIGLNDLRVFLTEFLVYYASPALGEGFLHYTEGWSMFVIVFLILCGLAWGIGSAESRLARKTV